jgi:hypothetical protein
MSRARARPGFETHGSCFAHALHAWRLAVAAYPLGASHGALVLDTVSRLQTYLVCRASRRPTALEPTPRPLQAGLPGGPPAAHSAPTRNRRGHASMRATSATRRLEAAPRAQPPAAPARASASPASCACAPSCRSPRRWSPRAAGCTAARRTCEPLRVQHRVGPYVYTSREGCIWQRHH